MTPEQTPPAMPEEGVAWTPHRGGDNPCADDDQVEIITRSGGMVTMRAGAVLWRYASTVWEADAIPLPSDAEVVFYRLALAREASPPREGVLREALLSELQPLIDKASGPNGWGWMFPIHVKPVDGKPTIVSHKGGNLFRGYIATWDEAELLVALANAAPRIVQALAANPLPEAARRDDGETPPAPAALPDRETIARMLFLAFWPHWSGSIELCRAQAASTADTIVGLTPSGGSSDVG